MSAVATDFEKLKHEYSEVNNNLRHYSALRFAILSVYFAVIGGISSVAFGLVEVKTANAIDIAWWAKIGGLLVTLVFASFEFLCDHNLRHLKNVAKELEKPLRYTQFTTRRSFFSFRAIYFTTVLYVALLAFWIFTILRRV